MKRFLSINEVGDYLGISRTHLWKLRKENILPTIEKHGRKYILKDAIDAYMLSDD